MELDNEDLAYFPPPGTDQIDDCLIDDFYPDDDEETGASAAAAAAALVEAAASFRGRASTWDPSFKRQQRQQQQQQQSTAEEVDHDASPGEAAGAASASGYRQQPASGTELFGSRLSGSAAAAAAAAQKRRNAWGSQSYAELITQAIQSSQHGRLTLAEIYDWMVRNVPYFTARSDSASSAGWKNSVRHNLSLHNKFVRVQNDQSGKSSYWTINYEVRDRASYRRRAATAEARNSELLQKRQSVLARRAAAAKVAAAVASAGGATPEAATSPQPQQSVSSAPSTPQPQQQQQQQQPSMQQSQSRQLQQPLPRTLSVTEVIRDLVPPERLLDGSRTTEELLLESLTEAVLQQAEGLHQPVQALEQRLHQLSCGKTPPLSPHHQHQHQHQHQVTNGWCCDPALPDIQEAAEQPSTSTGVIAGASIQAAVSSYQAQPQHQRHHLSDFLMEELA